MIQHHLNPLPQGSLLRSTVAVSCCAGPWDTSPSRSITNSPQHPLSISSHLHVETFASPHHHRKRKASSVSCICFKWSSNDITLLQCCTVHERCQSFPLISRICPLATWLCSAPDIMAWPNVFFYSGLVLRRWTPAWRVEAHFQRLPVLWDTARFPATSRPKKSTALLCRKSGRTKSCMKTNCSHGYA